MEAGKGRGNIVLTKQNIDGQDYIRIDYANNQAIALLFSEDSDIHSLLSEKVLGELRA